MALTLTITAAGRAALVNAAHDGTAPVRIAAVGVSAQAFTGTQATTVLPAEIKRIVTLSGDVVAADTIHLIVRDESADNYTVRSLALYLADGTLFGAYGQPAVIVEKSTQALLLLAIDVRFADIAATALSFGDANFLNPAATVDRLGVVELATEGEAVAGADAVRAVTPRTAKRAVVDWIGYPPASRAGDTFGGRFGRDPFFHFDILNNSPIIQFDNGDFLRFNRAFDTLDIALGNSNRFTVGPTGAAILGNIVWHGGNDGSGSGLDADLLDGRDGAYYSDVLSRLGFVPARSTGQIFGGQLGRDASFHLDIVDNNPIVTFDNGDFLRFNRAFDTLDVALGDSNRFTVSPTGAAILGNMVWHAGNDGAGSGLDADLLDGRDGAYYADVLSRLGFVPARSTGQIFGGQLGRDASFHLDIVSNNPILTFDAGDFLRFNRSFDTLDIALGNSNRFTVSPTGAAILGNMVWHAGNDGSGSGLDADLLDGRDGAYYADVLSRLGFAPVQQGTGVGQLANPVKIGWSGSRLKATVDNADLGNIMFDTQFGDVWRSTNDGAGSGLDADLLDGRDGAYYADVAARLGFTPVRDSQISDVWRSTNDGAGSGLDADLLDGQHATAFARMTDFANSLSAAGYQRLPGGLILQWCTTATQQNIETTTTATFPVAFPTAVLDVQLTTRVDAFSVENDMWYQLIGEPSLSGCTIGRARSDADSDRPSFCRVFAIGY